MNTRIELLGKTIEGRPFKGVGSIDTLDHTGSSPDGGGPRNRSDSDGTGDSRLTAPEKSR